MAQFQLVEKYDGMFIFSVEWANRKGYQVVTQLVGSEADVE